MGLSPSCAWVSTSVRAGFPVEAVTRARYSGTGIPRGRSISRVSLPSADPAAVGVMVTVGEAGRVNPRGELVPMRQHERTVSGFAGSLGVDGAFANGAGTSRRVVTSSANSAHLVAVGPRVRGRGESGDELFALGQALEPEEVRDLRPPAHVDDPGAGGAKAMGLEQVEALARHERKVCGLGVPGAPDELHG